MITIKVSDITNMALSDEAGTKLRTEILQKLKLPDGKDGIILDFTGINLFATMFFNASIGYFILELSPDKAQELIKCVNLSKLGLDTLNHSRENAMVIYKEKQKTDIFGTITKESIENEEK